MKWNEQAQRLCRKAAIDEQAMAILAAHASSADEVIGFHAQQAVEKFLKAALSHHRVAFAKTHDLVQLLNLLKANGIAAPPEDSPALDRTWVAECVRKTREWVEVLLGADRQPGF